MSVTLTTEIVTKPAPTHLAPLSVAVTVVLFWQATERAVSVSNLLLVQA